MSADEWGPLVADWTSTESLDQNGQSRQRQRTPGKWQETLEVSIYGEKDWTLPGNGSRPDSCGDWYPAEWCDHEAHLKMGRSACETRDCPECWSRWTGTRTARAVERLAAARHAAEEGFAKRAVHAVISAPEGSITSKQDVYRGTRNAYGLAKEHGVRGGVVIPHLFRIKKDVLKVIQAHRDLDRFDGSDWQWVREHERHWRDLVYWSPHWHVVGLCRDFEAGQVRDDGWLVRNIRSLHQFRVSDESGYEDMIGVTRYLLSHVTYDGTESRQAIRWFGDLSPAGFSPEDAVSDGVWKAIQRYVDELLLDGSGRDDGPESDDDRECPVDGCDGRMHSIWEAGDALQDKRLCDDLGRAGQHRLKVAWEWMVGDRQPPAGLKGPNREPDAAREVFEALHGDRYELKKEHIIF